MKEVIRIIDVQYNTGNDGKPIIRITGRNTKGKKKVYKTNKFRPYLYVESDNEPKTHPSHLIQKVKKNYKTTEKLLWKITGNHPADIRKMRDYYEKSGMKTYESDILFNKRFMYDAYIGDFAEVEYEDDKIKFIGPIEPTEEQLKKLGTIGISFDLEWSPSKSYVYCACMSVMYRDNQIGTIEITKDSCKIDGMRRKEFEKEGHSDYGLIYAFKKVLETIDPDFITGWYINGADIPKMQERFKLHRIKSPFKERYSGWEREGTGIFDMMDVAQRAIRPKSLALDDVSKELEVGGKDQDITASMMDYEWVKNKHKVISYCSTDSMLPLLIGEHEKVSIFPNSEAIGHIAMLPYAMSFMPRQSAVIDSILIRECKEKNYTFDRMQYKFGPCPNCGATINLSVSKKCEQCEEEIEKDKIEGAAVINATPGLHEHVLVLDFMAMYPTFMIENNICFTTYMGMTIPVGESPRKYHVTPNGAVFLKNPIGIIPNAQMRLRVRRNEFKALFKESGSPRHKAIEQAIKVVSVSFYGVIATDWYRFTNKNMGEAVTTSAKAHILGAAKAMQDGGNNVLYGDTDSLFIDANVSSTEDAIIVGKQIASEFSTGNKVFEFEKVLGAWFNHGVKKRYYGLVTWPYEKAGTIYERGYPTRRRDGYEYQKKLVKNLLDDIVHTGDGDKACYKAYKTIESVIGAPILDLAIRKSAKHPSHYKYPERMAQVQAANKMRARGEIVVPGMKVAYIVTDARRPPQIVEPVINGEAAGNPDNNYYKNSLVKTIKDICIIFGWDDKSLIHGKKAKTLDEWM